MIRNFMKTFSRGGAILGVALLFPQLQSDAQPPQQQEKDTIEESKSTSTPAPAPGAYLVPGTSANPLATPDSLPSGVGEVLLQPQTEITIDPYETAHDDVSYSKTLFELLEYQPDGKNGNITWDLERWQGGDYRRWWIKSEGKRSVHSSDYDADLQLLRGKLIRPFTEFQYGVRLQAQGGSGSNIARPQAVIGLQSTMPYEYELEMMLQVDARGNISGSLKAERDLLITQKLILQPRLETEVALQQVERFGVGRGLNNIDLGVRLRYEIRRELAPYIGVIYRKNFGKTATFAEQSGFNPQGWGLVAGVRMWF